jgi:gliding motility-associated-like protein
VITPTICSGNSSLLTASGASTYSWSTGANNTNTISVSPPGNTNYTVTGTDANGCKNSTVGTVSVSASVTVTVNDPIICTGFTTTLTATGATSYSWNTGSAAQTITVSPTVTTSYTVTGSQNGCSATEFGTVTVVGTPTLTVTSATVCLGGGDTLTAMGASHYTWTPTTGLSSSTNSMVIASPMVTTTYTVLGVAGTCSATSTGVLTVNPLPTITATSGTICIGQQTATLTASGANTYTWSPGGSLSPSTGTTVIANPSTTQVYTVTGTDGNGCINKGTANVTVNPLPIITATSGTICLGQQTATLTASGANTYTWSPTTNITPTVGNPVTANPLSTQIYTVTGTDVKGCVNTGTTSVTVNPIPNVTATSTSVCPTFAGTISAGGASTYTWSTSFIGANLTLTPTITTSYTVSGTDINTCTNTAVGTINVFPTLTVTANSSTICIGQQTAALTASGAVNYSWSPALNLSPTTGSVVDATPNTTTVYTVTGVVGTCSATATSTVTVNSLPTITATSGIICVGQQTATLTANGGVTYTWTPSTGLSNPTGSVVTGNPPATQTYVVTGTDANGCTNTGSTVITVLQLPIVTATSTSVCPGAPGTITANGATGYSWNVTPPVMSSILTQTPAATTNYIVTGTDTHGCTNTAAGNIYVYNAFSISVNNASICAAGQQTATLTASGASTYVWNPVSGITSNTGSTVYSTPSAVSTVYTVTGTSAVGSCTATATSNLTVNPLPQPIATSNTPCVSQQALSFSCTPAGLPLYVWSGPNSYTATGSNPTVPPSNVTTGLGGVYTVAVTDNNLCTNTAIVNVAIYSLPIITATVAPVCLGQTITLTASGGVSYIWSHQAEQPPFVSGQNPTVRPNSTVDMAGIYGITGTDANGCVSPGFATVVVNTLPAITATVNAICVGQTANLTASGASTYTWSGTNLVLPTMNPANANPMVTSVYNVTGTDANGCVNTTTVSLNVNPLPTVSVTPIAPECIPYCPTYAYTSNSSAAQSTYIWNFGGHDFSTQASPVHCFTVAGTWPVSLTLTDANGCVNTATTSVTTFAIPTASFTYGQQPVSVLAPEVQFNNQSTSGLNYNWIFGDTAGVSYSATNPMHIYSSAGDYTVTLTVSTNQGCSAITHEIIQIFDDYVLYVPNAFTPNADGKNEIFKPVGEGITDYKLFIFDRWGSLIFFSDDINKGWDGTYQAKNGEILLQDVFVWKIQVKNVLNQYKDLNGTVTLLK